MNKRIRAMTFGLVLLMIVVGIAGATPAQTFNDVPPSHQFYQFIEDFGILGITGGCGGGAYCPGNVTTRGQMAVFVVRLWKLATTGSTSGPLVTSPPWIRLNSSSVRTALNGDTVIMNDASGDLGVSLDPDGGYYRFYNPGGYAELWLYDGDGTARQWLKANGSVTYRDSTVTYEDESSNTKYQYSDGVHYGDQTNGNGDFVISTRDDLVVKVDTSNDSVGGLCVADRNGTYKICLNENGDFNASGTKSAVMDTASYGRVKLYAVEATQNWFEDFGSAQLNNGSVEVAIDPIFAETVNLNEEYHVLTTAQCDQPAVLYVSNKSASSFVVQGRDLANQPSNCAFSYRISAKRLGYETERLGLGASAASLEQVQDTHTSPPPVSEEAPSTKPGDPGEHGEVQDTNPGWANYNAENQPKVDLNTLLIEGDLSATE